MCLCAEFKGLQGALMKAGAAQQSPAPEEELSSQVGFVITCPA
jgi:hypothetical protein